MRFTRLFSATALVAAVTLLASCGESSSPTSTSAGTDPSFAAGPREFTITPNPISWTKLPADPIPTDTRTVLIGGVIAVASYPTFGTPVYTGSQPGANWLDINTAPNFSLSPLGWKVTFKLKQSAQALPIGTYTATIPVMLPAATNNPQNIVVNFSNCGNCLFLGDTRLATVATGPTFDWYANDYFNTGNRTYFTEYRLILRPGETAWIIVYSSAFGNGATIGDPTVAVFNSDGGFTPVGYDDDSCLGLTSVFGGDYPANFYGGSAGSGIGQGLTNTGLTNKEFLVRVGTYSGLNTGTENIYISPTNPCGGGGGGDLRASLPDDIQAIISAKAAHGGH